MVDEDDQWQRGHWSECRYCERIFRQKDDRSLPHCGDKSCARRHDWAIRDPEKFKRNDLIRKFFDQPECSDNRAGIIRAFYRIFKY